jgi:hypothetical protein
MPEETYDPELATVESALASLAPSAGRLDRDQLLFRAGQASARQLRWPWPVASALLAALAIGLGVIAFWRSEPQRGERIVYVQVEPPASSSRVVPGDSSAVSAGSETSVTDSPPSSPISYYRLEQVALRWGVEGLPNPRTDASSEIGNEPERLTGLRGEDGLSLNPTP